MRVFIKILQVPYLRPRPNIMDRWLAIHFFSSLPSSKTLIWVPDLPWLWCHAIQVFFKILQVFETKIKCHRQVAGYTLLFFLAIFKDSVLSTRPSLTMPCGFLSRSSRYSRQRSNTIDRWPSIIAHPQYQTFLDHAMRVFIKILQVFEAKTKYHRQVAGYNLLFFHAIFKDSVLSALFIRAYES